MTTNKEIITVLTREEMFAKIARFSICVVSIRF
jgi:hypothetical protein